MEDLTRPSTHVWRLGKWARTLARHGTLRGIARDPNVPRPVKRLIWFFSLGTRKSRRPDYATAFQEIGPAAIKLGQTLATRPDIVGAEAAASGPIWTDAADAVRSVLASTTIADVAEREARDSAAPMYYI